MRPPNTPNKGTEGMQQTEFEETQRTNAVSAGGQSEAGEKQDFDVDTECQWWPPEQMQKGMPPNPRSQHHTGQVPETPRAGS